ncbi:aspartate aminotransferase family protein [Rhodococcus sp. BP-349]|uniref:aspartate aminotransferase family protein n=1 Tax=unclassified Rhodococcus (in: high G+C Gram-positive bacteria) TaxID=192944 RepID=UPI001C9AC444|nr:MULTISPECIES: aspartate aminotransferase family protein [unclassified Rhodococcus (in: high G+C Gram-positive bacteria)]MBY6540185.1 aspartate aminotransferase family protein [Rhodococcus sp. BP-363]MBY6543487.1 aspartate aminotransferase family protein [Rhodococcus sp. BP-369]MBY6562717.1 aspartate aminotransferase family protein [Rhodococcus sp. BP-370]MBY6577009.1 aspartate aminotransferase family protein [Rhodococcus sp. BP-364]MBY6586310.1 aspartate aminotransferase family protein [Rho
MTDHVFYSWSAQAELNPVTITGASGSYFWDNQGRKYLDFSSQLVNVNIGHQHPDIVAAIVEQAGVLTTISPTVANDKRSELARLIAERAPGDLNRVFFTTGGAEAVEHAVRFARQHTGRTKMLAAYRSYHGGTGVAIGLTGEPRRWGTEPTNVDVVRFFGPYPYRSPWNTSSPEEETAAALAHLEMVITLEGPQNIAGLILESVVGTNGVLVPPPGYLAGVRELCTRYGIVYIADEVMVGFGRTGHWFACQAWGVEPDLITFAKGVNSGYVPLGGVVISEEIAQRYDHTPYPGGLTYSGHVLGCAAGIASIRVFERDDILGHVRAVGEEILGPGLTTLGEAHPSVGDVRGMGFFWAVELVTDKGTREPLTPFNATGAAAAPMAAVTKAAKERGLWPFVAGNRLQIAPPLVTTEEDIRRGLEILDEVLEVADGYTRN